jgi:predicted transposase YdaD
VAGAIEAMPITYDINTDYLYNKGVAKGKREGKKEGKREGMRTIILNLLQNSSMTPEEIAKVTKVPLKEVLRIKNSI